MNKYKLMYQGKIPFDETVDGFEMYIYYKNILNENFKYNKPYVPELYRNELLLPNFHVIHLKYIESINKMIAFCEKFV